MCQPQRATKHTIGCIQTQWVPDHQQTRTQPATNITKVERGIRPAETVPKCQPTAKKTVLATAGTAVSADISCKAAVRYVASYDGFCAQTGWRHAWVLHGPEGCAVVSLNKTLEAGFHNASSQHGKKRVAPSENRTRVNCVGGNYDTTTPTARL